MPRESDRTSGSQVRTLTYRDFSIASVQVVVYTPDEQISGVKLSKQLLPLWSSRFDGQPVVLPIDDIAPPEVPRVILSSKSGQWRCQISSKRFEVIWQRLANDSSSPPMSAAVRIANEYREFLRARIGRLALVITSIAEHEEPGKFLARHFCRDEWLTAPFNRPAQFELHAHKIFSLSDDLRVNSWVRNRVAAIARGQSSRPIVAVEQDLNTLVDEEPTRDFRRSDIGEYFRAASSQMRSILRLYYPQRGTAAP